MSRPVGKFKVGDKVRVKRGVADMDYPDLPMGGWLGTVFEEYDRDTLMVRWTRETMNAVHPVFEKRCQIDGLDPERYGLPARDLELDSGGPLDIEQPTKITTRPLSANDEDDRIRMAFGLTSNDPLPCVNMETLRTYREYLDAKLVFPFEAKHASESGPFNTRTTQVKITGLGDSGDEVMVEDHYGLLCEAAYEGRNVVLALGEVEVVKRNPNKQLVDDYSSWFWNQR